MADPVTKLELENASVDAGDLGDILNSDSSTTVTTRLGLPVKSVANAVAGISSYDDKGAWLTSTGYVIKDLVQESGITYICTIAHTSGTFATDKAAGKWGIFQTQLPEVLLSEHASLSAAIAAIGATETTLLLDTASALTGDLVQPSTLVFKSAAKGNAIDVSTHTLTMNGGLIAGEWQVFDVMDGGKVTGLSSLGKVLIEWFGGVGDGDNANEQINLAACVGAARSLESGGIIKYGVGNYQVGNGAATYNFAVGDLDGVTIQGAGKDVTEFDMYKAAGDTSTLHGALFHDVTGNIALKDIHIKNDDFPITSNRAFLFFDGVDFTASHCKFTATYRPMRIGGGATITDVENVRFIHCDFIRGKQTFSAPVISVNCDFCTDSYLYVEGCTFDGSKGSTGHDMTLVDVTAQRVKVINNDFKGGAYTGCVNIEDCNPGPCVVANNTFDMSVNTEDTLGLLSAIGIQGADGAEKCTVTGNTIKGAAASYTTHGITVYMGPNKTDVSTTEIVIADNTIFDVEWGVYDDSVYRIANMLITGNSIRASEYAIYLYTSLDSGGTNVSILGNKLGAMTRFQSTVDQSFTFNFTDNVWIGTTGIDAMIRATSVIGVVGNNTSTTVGIRQYDVAWAYDNSVTPATIDNMKYVGLETFETDIIDLDSGTPYQKIIPIDYAFTWISVDRLYVEAASADAGIYTHVNMWGADQTSPIEGSGYWRRYREYTTQSAAITTLESEHDLFNNSQPVDVDAANISIYSANNKTGAGEIVVRVKILPDAGDNLGTYGP